VIEIERGDKMKKMGESDLLQKLKKKRKEIDLIDQKLLTLLNQRLRIAQEIGKIKKEMGKKIYDPEREKEILEKLKIKNKGPMKEEGLKKVFNIIIKVCRKSQI
jgi:chorismate mutase/prephenate dehydratase